MSVTVQRSTYNGIKVSSDGSLTVIAYDPITFERMINLKRAAHGIPSHKIVYAPAFDFNTGTSALVIMKNVRWSIINSGAEEKDIKDALSYLDSIKNKVYE